MIRFQKIKANSSHKTNFSAEAILIYFIYSYINLTIIAQLLLNYKIKKYIHTAYIQYIHVKQFILYNKSHLIVCIVSNFILSLASNLHYFKAKI